MKYNGGIVDVENEYQSNSWGYNEPIEVRCGLNAYRKLRKEVRAIYHRVNRIPVCDGNGHLKYNAASIVLDKDKDPDELEMYTIR